MRIILLITTALLLSNATILAQAPQGLNYQAVAYNASAVPVTNQLLGLRLSILDGSATGTLVYQETQNPTSDNTGLFSIVIGNGTVVSGTFSTINWGNGSKWLKTEIDITGGTNYLVMGTSQFMSVPYALYANQAAFTSGSFELPEGFNNVTPIIVPGATSYTVPAGKNLYISNISETLIVDGDTLRNGYWTPWIEARSRIGVSENSIIKTDILGVAGFLVDKKVDWKTINLRNGSFTVPANKQLVIVNYMNLANSNIPNDPAIQSCVVTLNSVALPYRINLTNSIIDENTVIDITNCASHLFIYYAINGYLKDK